MRQGFLVNPLPKILYIILQGMVNGYKEGES